MECIQARVQPNQTKVVTWLLQVPFFLPYNNSFIIIFSFFISKFISYLYLGSTQGNIDR